VDERKAYDVMLLDGKMSCTHLTEDQFREVFVKGYLFGHHIKEVKLQWIQPVNDASKRVIFAENVHGSQLS
jgi:tRNA A-37 threonylcarbamoyl transferase component Bud32